MVQLHSYGSFVEDPLSNASTTFIFLFGATYDTLPFSSNLHRWHIKPEVSCLLCKKHVCTTDHVLEACTVALQQGRLTFYHESVLSVLVVALESFFSSKKCINAPSKNSIKFVKAGTQLSKILKSYILDCYTLQLIGSY